MVALGIPYLNLYHYNFISLDKISWETKKHTMDSLQKQILVEAYPNFLRLATKILKNRWYAQDVVQDAVLVTLTSPDVQDPVSYCLGVVWKKCYSLLRSKKYCPVPEPDTVPWLSYNPEDRDMFGDTRYAFKQLSPELQQILNLKYVEELPDQAIARTCHIHRSTVHRKLKRAKHLFKSRFQELSLYYRCKQ